MLIIAHRGASGYEPENTRLAFQKAISLNADMVMFDVRKCKSGEIVVIYDATVNRTTNGRGFVKIKTFPEIKVLNAGKGEKIPTLQEAITTIGKNKKININIVETSAIEPTIKIIGDYIKEGWNKDNFLISSFKFFKLAQLKTKYPFVQFSPVLVFFPTITARKLMTLKPFSLHVEKKFISKRLVEFAHQYSIHVYVWTVNERQEIEKMEELGVDGIITDFPDKARRLLSKNAT